MTARFRQHIRSNIVSYVALFGFAIGGTAHAVDGPLAGQNTIGSEDIIGNEVKSDDIGNGRIFNLDIADEIIQADKVQDDTLTGADLAADTLTGTQMDESTLFNDNSLNTADIDESTLFNDNSVAAADLAPDSATAQVIAPSAVGTSEAGTLTDDDLGPNSVNSSEITAGAVKAGELTDVSVQRQTDTVDASQTADFLIVCPAGQQAIGGGEIGGSQDVWLNSSFPSESAEGSDFPEDGDPVAAWWFRYQNVSAIQHSVTSFALCVEAS